MKRRLTTLFAAGLLAAAPALAVEPTVEELLDNVDDYARGESSFATMRMHVKTDRYERSMEMEAWSKGTEKSLIRILAPAKEKGISTLKVDDNIWNYMPKVDRTIKVPAGMMSGGWMGSHISNDDLVKENRLSEQFTAAITTRPEGDTGFWTIELTPKADAAVVWGKVVATVHASRQPRDVQYYDEDSELVRTMSFHDLKDYDGRTLPTRMRVTPADKPDEFTEITYVSIDFDVELDDRAFSLQALRK